MFQQSLGTKDSHIAKILALKFCLTLEQGMDMRDPRDLTTRYELDLATGKAKANGPADHAMMMEAAQMVLAVEKARAELAAHRPPQSTLWNNGPSTAARVPAPAPTAGTMLQEAFDRHLVEEIREGLVDQTIGEKRVLFREFVDCFGNAALNDITKTEITARWRKEEFARPNKKYKGQTVSGARLEKRRGYLHKFFEWAIEGGDYHHENPATQKMATKKAIKAATESFAEFSSDDLGKLFGSHYALEMNKPDWYWLPLMSMFSGARLSEVADLSLENFDEIEGIKCFEIRQGKTPDSRRGVPIHSKLLELGLWEYVQALKNLSYTHLIPHRPNKIRGKSVGLAWGKWVTRCGIKDKRKVFHSFRSTAITDLHNADAGHASIRETVGHSPVGVSGAHGGYIRGIQLAKRQATIEKLDFPTVDIEALKVPDPTFSAFFAAEALKANDPKTLQKIEQLKNHAAKRAERLARVEKARTRKPIA